MKPICPSGRLVAALLLLTAAACGISHAQMKTFIKEYTLVAGEADSKLTARATALEQVKGRLLEEVSVYIRSTFEITDTEKSAGDSLNLESLTKRQTTAITAGITETKVLDERWNGVQYYIKAEITLDPSDVARKVQNVMSAENNLVALEESRRKADEAMNEVIRLRQELEKTKSSSEKRQLGERLEKQVMLVTASDWFERGYRAGADGQLREAVINYGKALDLDPNHVEAYNNRGAAKFLLAEYRAALADYDSALVRRPAYAEVYYNRGLAKAMMRDYQGAEADYGKAISLKRNYALAYYSRGALRSQLRDYPGAVADYTKAIETKAGFARAYYSRGGVKVELRDYDGAIGDYDTAIALEPGTGMFYLARGLAWQRKGVKEKEGEDFRRAKECGYNVPAEWIEEVSTGKPLE